jgi:DNA-binding transcriptional regulator of glucitol operon
MWTSGRAVSLHVALVVFIPGCVALTWWQVSRALGGNTLSWVYTFEWPLFGAYATYMWWKLVHDEPAPDSSAPDGPAAEPRDAPPAPWRQKRW